MLGAFSVGGISVGYLSQNRKTENVTDIMLELNDSEKKLGYLVNISTK